MANEPLWRVVIDILRREWRRRTWWGRVLLLPWTVALVILMGLLWVLWYADSTSYPTHRRDLT